MGAKQGAHFGGFVERQRGFVARELKILALDFLGKPLAPEWGAPVRLRIPTKLGFKSAKNIKAISVTNTYPGGYWEDQGYDWFSGS